MTRAPFVWSLAACLTGCAGDSNDPGDETPGAFCEFPTFARDSTPLKTKDAGNCDADLAALYGGNCENFQWLGLMGDPTVMHDGSRFRMWFTGGARITGPTEDPLWEAGIVAAESADGVLWEDPKDLTNDVVPVLRPGTAGIDETGVETPAIVLHEGEYRLYYTGDRSVAPSSVHVIGLASSTDGDSWVKADAPVLTATLPWEQPFDAGGFEVGGVLEPTVMVDEGTWKLWYQGFGQLDGEVSYSRFGYAESLDGLSWEKRDDPIFTGEPDTFEALGVGHTNVVRDPSGGYHLFYVGIGLDEQLRMGHAYSDDGLAWQRNPNNPIIEGVAGEFDAGVVGGPSALFVDGELWLYYMGTGSPDFSQPAYFGLSKGTCE